MADTAVVADATVATDAAADSSTTVLQESHRHRHTAERHQGHRQPGPGTGRRQSAAGQDLRHAGLAQTLAAVVPALEVANTGGDLSALTLQRHCAHLSPNDTLVLINGKRRHTTSNIDVAWTDNFGGGAGADLNLIPADAIDHIEVLTDGAALNTARTPLAASSISSSRRTPTVATCRPAMAATRTAAARPTM